MAVVMREKIDNFLCYLGRIVMLLGHVINILFTKKPRFNLLYRQFVKIGLESLPIVFLTSIFIGIVIALQSAYQMLLAWERLIRETEDCTMHVTKDEQNTEANTDN